MHAAATTGTNTGQPAESVADFRRRGDQWLAANAPRQDVSGDMSAARAFQAALRDAGLAGVDWPAEYGGQGLTGEHRRAFEEAMRPYPAQGPSVL